MVEEFLFKTGVPTFRSTISLKMPTAAQAVQELGDVVPTNVGWLYGMSIACGGTTPTDQTQNLLTLADADNLWLNLKVGTAELMQTVRLSELVYVQSGVARTQNTNYYPLSIPEGIDWKKSTINNPTGIVNKTILIHIFYVDKPTYANLVQSGVIWKTGIKPDGR